MNETDARPPDAPHLTVHIITLFPNLFSSWLSQGVVSRAVGRGIAAVDIVDLRPFGIGRHHITDDYPFGGGPGMVMKPEPLFDAIAAHRGSADVPVILMSPAGRTFTQARAWELAGAGEIVLVSGHYEGVDERVRQHAVTEEISIGDYVLSAGELAAMVVTDAVVRLLPGALSDGSTEEESFAGSLLEYPQYTRPATFRGWTVPSVLVSGHHAEIAMWRRREAIVRTARVRPELLDRAGLSEEERAWVAELQDDVDGTMGRHS